MSVEDYLRHELSAKTLSVKVAEDLLIRVKKMKGKY